MGTVVVPVQFPLSERSLRTLREARRIAREREGRLVVLHINLYQNSKRRVTPTELKRAVEARLGYMPQTRYAVRDGFILEETLVHEVDAEGPDVVVVGERRGGVRGWIRRALFDEPDVVPFLHEGLDCEIVTVG